MQKLVSELRCLLLSKTLWRSAENRKECHSSHYILKIRLEKYFTQKLINFKWTLKIVFFKKMYGHVTPNTITKPKI